MSDARQALQAAREAGAAQHAGTAFKRAQALLHEAQQELDHRRYDAARQSAVAAKARAIDALREARRAEERRKP
ncbi:MAG TPA: hypothetical protein VKA14_04960 [Gammaproteobacteria bacterium]|nr:hypothetical protein [Gammaproteobacteria bacterium]